MGMVLLFWFDKGDGGGGDGIVKGLRTSTIFVWMRFENLGVKKFNLEK